MLCVCVIQLEGFECEHHAGGRLNAPEPIYDSVTKGVVGEIGRFLPASKGEVEDKTVAKAEFVEYKRESEEYKNRTNIVINTYYVLYIPSSTRSIR